MRERREIHVRPGVIDADHAQRQRPPSEVVKGRQPGPEDGWPTRPDRQCPTPPFRRPYPDSRHHRLQTRDRALRRQMARRDRGECHSATKRNTPCWSMVSKWPTSRQTSRRRECAGSTSRTQDSAPDCALSATPGRASIRRSRKKIAPCSPTWTLQMGPTTSSRKALC